MSQQLLLMSLTIVKCSLDMFVGGCFISQLSPASETNTFIQEFG